MSDISPSRYHFSLQNTPVTLGYKKSSHVSQTQHFHESFEILFIIGGRRHVFTGNNTLSLNKGDLLFIPPDILHKSLGLSGESEIYSLYLPDNGEFRKLPRESLFISSRTKTAERIRILLDSMADEFKSKTPGYELMISARSSEIAGCIMRSREIRTETPGTKIMAVTDFIGGHSHEDLSLGRLSEHFFLSESYLSRAFHRETGFTLVEYINHTRVLKARSLLKGTDKKISRIGQLCGFGSITHFGRIFKKLTGMSPRAYRTLPS